MSRGSIFDPEGWATEQSGDRYTLPYADVNSHMPPDVVDGKVSEEEAADLEKLAEANETPPITRETEDEKSDPDSAP